MKKLEIQIHELALYGFGPSGRLRIGEAVERELARLVGEQGAKDLASQRSVRKLDGGSFQVAPGANAETVGGQVARALHSGLVGKAGRR